MSTDQNLENVPDFIQKQAQAALDLMNQPMEEDAAAVPPQEESSPAPESVVTEEMTKEQRYKVLIGMQQAEARKAREIAEEKARLEQEVAELRARVTAPAPTEPQQTIPPEAMEQLTEAFGQQNLQYLDEYMRAKGYAKVDDLNTLRDEVGNVNRTVTSNARSEFFREMDRLTDGKWQQINQEDWFIEEMAKEEGLSGLTRQEIAQRYVNEMDAPKLARFFTEIKPPATKKQSDPRKRLTSPPSTPPRGPSMEDGEAPFVKTSELEKFSRDVITGKYAGREAERDAFNARIRSAMASGRVIQG